MNWSDKAARELDEMLELGQITSEEYRKAMRQLQDEMKEDSYYPEF